jgi:phosphinothricin acetyltransferase
MIRPATEADVPGILAIWNPVIRDTLVTFTDLEKTPEAVAALLAERRAAGHAFLVAEENGEVLGFATFGQFRGGPGYRHSFEHTILVASEARGRGLGRALIAALEEAARAAGGHVLLAGVSAANREGIAFHIALGYREAARLSEVGRKFGRWLDLVLMEKRL